MLNGRKISERLGSASTIGLESLASRQPLLRAHGHSRTKCFNGHRVLLRRLTKRGDLGWTGHCESYKPFVDMFSKFWEIGHV